MHAYLCIHTHVHFYIPPASWGLNQVPSTPQSRYHRFCCPFPTPRSGHPPSTQLLPTTFLAPPFPPFYPFCRFLTQCQCCRALQSLQSSPSSSIHNLSSPGSVQPYLCVKLPRSPSPAPPFPTSRSCLFPVPLLPRHTCSTMQQYRVTRTILPNSIGAHRTECCCKY